MRRSAGAACLVDSSARSPIVAQSVVMSSVIGCSRSYLGIVTVFHNGVYTWATSLGLDTLSPVPSGSPQVLVIRTLAQSGRLRSSKSHGYNTIWPIRDFEGSICRVCVLRGIPMRSRYVGPSALVRSAVVFQVQPPDGPLADPVRWPRVSTGVVALFHFGPCWIWTPPSG